jgi:hypothetical protein
MENNSAQRETLNQHASGVGEFAECVNAVIGDFDDPLSKMQLRALL